MAKGYCGAHYRRLKVDGSVKPDVPLRPFYDNPICKLAWCNRPTRSLGMCHLHARRARRGLPLRPGPYALPRRWIGNECTINSAHGRVRRLWGKASQYLCVICDKSAQDWAYDGTDPDALLVITGRERGMFYSRYPEFYMPMCRKCHHRRDAANAKRELFEYRLWKYRTGLTLAEKM